MSNIADKPGRDARVATGEAINRGLVEAHDSAVQKATRAGKDAVANVGDTLGSKVQSSAVTDAGGRPRPPTVQKQPTPPGDNLEPHQGQRHHDKSSDAGSEASPKVPPPMSLAQQKLREQDMKSREAEEAARHAEEQQASQNALPASKQAAGAKAGAGQTAAVGNKNSPGGQIEANARPGVEQAAGNLPSAGKGKTAAGEAPLNVPKEEGSPKAPPPMSAAQQKLWEQDQKAREAAPASGEGKTQAGLGAGAAAAVPGAVKSQAQGAADWAAQQGQQQQQQQQQQSPGGGAKGSPSGLSRGMEAARAPLPRQQQGQEAAGGAATWGAAETLKDQGQGKVSPTAAAAAKAGASAPSPGHRHHHREHHSSEREHHHHRSHQNESSTSWQGSTSFGAAAEGGTKAPPPQATGAFTAAAGAEGGAAPHQVVEKVVTTTTTTTKLPPMPPQKEENLCTLDDLSEMRKRVLDAAARNRGKDEATAIQPADHADLCVRLGRTTLDCSLNEHRCKLESGIRAIQELADRVRGIETAREDAAAAREGEVRDAERRMDENLEALRARVGSEVTSMLRCVEEGERTAADCAADVQRLIERVEEGTRTQTALSSMIQNLPPLAVIEGLVTRAERAAIDANKTLLGASDAAERLSKGTPSMMVALNALGAVASPTEGQNGTGNNDADAAATTARIADLRGRIASMMAAFSTLDGRLETLDDRANADEEALGTLRARVAELEGDVQSRYDRIVQDAAGEQARADETRDIIQQCTTALADARQRQEESLAAVRDGCARLERVMQEARSAQLADRDNSRMAAAAGQRSEELVAGALDTWTDRMAALTKQMERDSAAQWDVLKSLARTTAATGWRRQAAPVPRGYVETKTVREEEEVITQTRPVSRGANRQSPDRDRSGAVTVNTTTPQIEEVA